MYEEFYGFRVKPFQTIPDPAFLYWSDAHLMAFNMLRYGVMNEAPLTVITGEVGAGKTTLLREVLNDFPEDMTAGLISNMQAGRGELLEWALLAFDLPFEGGHVARFKRFQDFLLEHYANGRKVVLIIDEAQNLGQDQLEELRMLSNINAEQDQLLQIILLGQPELREILNRPELRQFSQRVLADFHLKTLERAEVREYIRRRLAVAGSEEDIFPAPICDLIYEATDGVPRLINVLCDLCLVYGYAAERKVIDEDLLRELTDSIEKNGIYNQMKAPNWRRPPKLVHENDAPRIHKIRDGLREEAAEKEAARKAAREEAAGSNAGKEAAGKEVTAKETPAQATPPKEAAEKDAGETKPIVNDGALTPVKPAVASDPKPRAKLFDKKRPKPDAKTGPASGGRTESPSLDMLLQRLRK